jgi:hypothetical protein
LKLPASCCDAVLPAACATLELEDVVLTWLGENMGYSSVTSA